MQSNPDTRSDDLLKNLCSDYSNYLVVDSSSEFQKLESAIKNLSANVEEFSSLLESIKLDTSLCVDNLLPQIASQYEQMRETFKQVDQLEVVVQKVNKSVTAMEAEVNAAESHLGSESVLKSIMRPFLPKAMSSNNHPTAPSQTTPPSYKPVDIFNSDQLFDQDNNTTSANQS